MTLKIDHVTVAGSQLPKLQQAFEQVGLPSEYGGPHSNGITHMALLGFEDGSYIELISTLEPDETAPIWGEFIANDGGPCAWAQAVNDIQVEAKRIAAAGVKSNGPTEMDRRRPDGMLVEWDVLYVGDGAGATLPFLIEDRTPRAWRVKPSPALAAKGLQGVARVVIGVQDLEHNINLFQRIYNLPEPLQQDSPEFGAKLAYFPNTPVVLAAPLGSGWLTTRLDQFGDAPCAYLLKSSDFDTALTVFGLSQTDSWFGRDVAWFDPQKLHGVQLGLIAGE